MGKAASDMNSNGTFVSVDTMVADAVAQGPVAADGNAPEPIKAESSGDSATPNQSESVDEIRHDIEQTRNNMSETIDAIQEKLNPEHIKEQVKDATIGRVKQMASTAGEKVQEVAGPATEKVQLVAQEAAHHARAITAQARDKGGPVISWVRQNPLPAAAAAIGFLFVTNRIFRRSSHQVERVEYYID